MLIHCKEIVAVDKDKEELFIRYFIVRRYEMLIIIVNLVTSFIISNCNDERYQNRRFTQLLYKLIKIYHV